MVILIIYKSLILLYYYFIINIIIYTYAYARAHAHTRTHESSKGGVFFDNIDNIGIFKQNQ